jgi:hypothetical protein
VLPPVIVWLDEHVGRVTTVVRSGDRRVAS